MIYFLKLKFNCFPLDKLNWFVKNKNLLLANLVVLNKKKTFDSKSRITQNGNANDEWKMKLTFAGVTLWRRRRWWFDGLLVWWWRESLAWDYFSGFNYSLCHHFEKCCIEVAVLDCKIIPEYHSQYYCSPDQDHYNYIGQTDCNNKKKH